jgi:uncharacterized protein with NRDE domain
MCLLLLALNRVPERPWLLLGNRDEFHGRPTAPAAVWDDAPLIAGGRDLTAGGSWLAVSRGGRYSAVTNVRAATQAPAPRSRGALVGDFVKGSASVDAYLRGIAARRNEYGPFNLIVGDGREAGFVSSIDGIVRKLEDGIHAFSNGSPLDDWPKMHRLRAHFSALIDERQRAIAGLDDARARDQFDRALLDLLFDTTQPDDGALPDTGVGLDLERRLAPIFVMPIDVRGESYGTRASTLAYAHAGRVILRERSFDALASVSGETALAI